MQGQSGCTSADAGALDASATRAHTRSLLENYFLKADVEQLAQWHDPDHSPLSQTVTKIANDYIRGLRLAEWARRCNEKVSAMPTASLINKFNVSSSDVQGTCSLCKK